MHDLWDSYWKSSWTSSWEKVFRKILSEVYFSLIKDFSGELKEKKILELGSGTGLISGKLAEFGAEVTLIDSSIEALNIAKKNFQFLKVKGNFICEDILALNKKSLENKFDIVFSEGLVEHFSGKERQEIFNLHEKFAKKDGGKIFIVIPNKYNLPRVLLRKVADFISKRGGRKKEIFLKIPQQELTTKELFNRMKKSGLEEIKIKGVLFPLSHLTLFYLLTFFFFVPYLILLLIFGSKLINLEKTGIKKFSFKRLMFFSGEEGGKDDIFNSFNRIFGYEIVGCGLK